MFCYHLVVIRNRYVVLSDHIDSHNEMWTILARMGQPNDLVRLWECSEALDGYEDGELEENFFLDASESHREASYSRSGGVPYVHPPESL